MTEGESADKTAPSSSDRTVRGTPPPRSAGSGDSDATLRLPRREDEPATLPSVLPPGAPARRFGRFVLLEELGSGGMGTVYRAQQTDLDRVVALKTLHGSSAAGSAQIERFQREARAAARLDHPGIVRIFEVGEEAGIHYFTMELVEGENLLARATNAAVPLHERVRWIRDAALAVHHAHENGLVHRDLKPQNLLIDAKGVVKVADFGLARDASAGKGLTVSGEVMGTPSYMAPEQARGDWERVGSRSDVYSLGATLYELICGAPPAEAPEIYKLLEKVAQGDLVPLRSRAPQVPRDLETIVAKALDLDPSRRYATARDLADDLDRFLRFEAITARPETLLQSIARRVRRNRGRLIAGVLVTTLIAAGTWLVLVKRRQAQAAKDASALERDRTEARRLFSEAMDPEHVRLHGGIDRQRQLLRRATELDSSCFDAWYRLALVNEWTDARDEAFRCYGEAIRCRPDFRQAQGRVAILHMLAGDAQRTDDIDWKAAREILGELDRIASDDPYTRLVHVVMEALTRGKEDSPSDLFDRAKSLVHDVPDARIFLAGFHGFFYHPARGRFPAFSQFRDLGAAFQEIQQFVSADPLNLLGRMDQGLIRYELGDLQGAEQDLRFVADQAASWDNPHYFLARVQVSLRKLDEAEASTRCALGVHRSAHHLNLLAMILGLEKKYAEALDVLDESLHDDPDEGDTIALRGMVLYLLGREPEAAVEMDRYLATDQEYLQRIREADVYGSRPEVQMLLKTGRDHLLDYESILSLAPREKAIVRTLVTAIQALPQVKEMVEKRESRTDVHYDTQNIFMNIPQYEREIARFDEFLSWTVGRLGLRVDPHGALLLSEFLSKLIHESEILRCSTLLTAQDFAWRAGAYYRFGKLDNALADLQEAQGLDGSSARIEYGLATIYAKKGDAPHCADALTRARQLGWEHLAWVKEDADFEKVRDASDVKAALEGR